MSDKRLAYRQASEAMTKEMEKVGKTFDVTCPPIADLMRAADEYIADLDHQVFQLKERLIRNEAVTFRTWKIIKQAANMALEAR